MIILLEREVIPVFANFADFFNAVKEARFGFGSFWQWVTELYYSITENADIAKIWSGIMRFIAPFYGAVPYILIVLSLVVAFFGRKMMPVLKFAFFFLIGFVLGVYYITPWIANVVAVPGWVCGLVIAVVAAVLYRFLYIAGYSVACIYSVYILCYSGFYIKQPTAYTTGKALVCLAVAAIALILAILLQKYLEMFGTALLGGYFVAIIFRAFIFDYRTLGFLANAPKVATFAISFLIAVPAAVFQYRTRRKYK